MHMRWYLTTTSLHFQFIVSIRLPFIRAILILDLLQVWVVSVQLQLPYNDRIEEKRSTRTTRRGSVVDGYLLSSLKGNIDNSLEYHGRKTLCIWSERGTSSLYPSTEQHRHS